MLTLTKLKEEEIEKNTDWAMFQATDMPKTLEAAIIYLNQLRRKEPESVIWIYT